MGKKDNGAAVDAASTVVGATVGLDARLSAVFATLTPEEQKEFEAMSLEDRILELSMIADISESSVSLLKGANLKAAKEENINLPILTAGGPGLRAGTKIAAFFMGVHHVFSKEVKENWKPFKGNKQMYYYNSYLKFKTRDGKEFGIWNSATLSILTKVLTHSSAPGIIAKDPLVAITYVGLVEGREVLERDYGIVLTTGNKAHVFTTDIEEGAQIMQYKKGVFCNLNAPTPIESDEDSAAITKEDATRSNYERLMALQSPENQVTQLLAGGSVQ